MKRIILMAGLLFCSEVSFATESSQDDRQLLAQSYGREQVLRAYYVSDGELSVIKIKIQGEFVIAYSTGKDFVGQENWNSVIPAAHIRPINSSLDGYEMAREFDYTATLTLTNGYKTIYLKIYF